MTMNIAIVDNDRAFLRSVELLLSTQGHRVQCFDNPVAACRELAAEQPDVLLLDVVMPELSGFGVLETLRRDGVEPQAVILVSGHQDEVQAIDLAELGISAFLAKPVDFDQLLGALDSSEMRLRRR